MDKERKTIDIRLAAPTAWRELTQEQLRFVLRLIATTDDPVKVKTKMLLRFCCITVLRKTRLGWKCAVNVGRRRRAVYLKEWQVTDFIRQFDFIDTREDMDCRLDAVCGLMAVDPLLHGVSFGDYLMAEKYYQMYLATRDDGLLDNLACWLYVDAHGLHPGQEGGGRKNDTDMVLHPEERLGTLLWYSHVKDVLARSFPNFFRKADGDDSSLSAREIVDQYNLQLRALTNGDPTKEADVLALDCWRALTELDAKAREARELERIRNRH